MQVHSDISNIPFFNNAVITIGTFDGVHTGHLQIINQLKKEAKEINGESVIITFHPHPRMVVNNPASPQSHSIKLLNTLSEKIELLKTQHIDHLIIVPFTLEFSGQSAEEYISEFLVSKFHPHTIIIGYDHRFGKNRGGDYKLLESYQSKYTYLVKEIPEHVLHNVIISSTKIRECLAEGNITDANEALGYSYFFEGKVVDGDKLGRRLGYPTANIDVTDKNKLIPGHGIYAVQVSIGKSEKSLKDILHQPSYKGMMSIGIRPTVGGTKRVIEVNIFDFNKSIYDETIRVYIEKYMRPEVKFDGLEELKEQLSRDKIDAMKILNAG